MRRLLLVFTCFLFLVSSISAYELEFYHSDHLGSPVLVIDEAGEEVWSSDYDVFGEAVNEEGVGDLKYNQKEKDDTGLLYYGARYYNPDTGRFITADTVKGSVGSLQSQNLYVYVRNNPMKYIDPTGHQLELASYDIPYGGSSVKTAVADSRFYSFVFRGGLADSAAVWAENGDFSPEMMRKIDDFMWNSPNSVPYDNARLDDDAWIKPYVASGDTTVMNLGDFFDYGSTPAEGCGPVCFEYAQASLAAYDLLKKSAVGAMHPRSFTDTFMTDAVTVQEWGVFSSPDSSTAKYSGQFGHMVVLNDDKSAMFTWGQRGYVQPISKSDSSSTLIGKSEFERFQISNPSSSQIDSLSNKYSMGSDLKEMGITSSRSYRRVFVFE